MATTKSRDEIALQDAAISVSAWGAAARRNIDDDFGPGYADAHPELVAAYIKASAMQFLSITLTRSITEAADRIADAWLEVQPDVTAPD